VQLQGDKVLGLRGPPRRICMHLHLSWDVAAPLTCTKSMRACKLQQLSLASVRYTEEISGLTSLWFGSIVGAPPPPKKIIKLRCWGSIVIVTKCSGQMVALLVDRCRCLSNWHRYGGFGVSHPCAAILGGLTCKSTILQSFRHLQERDGATYLESHRTTVNASKRYTRLAVHFPRDGISQTSHHSCE
jgi:hypothetical protein